MIYRGVVALSLALLALCALVRTFGHGHRDHHRGPWGQECGQWGHGGRMGGCGMKSRMMMGCPSKDMDDDMNEDELPARRAPEPRPDKK